MVLAALGRPTKGMGSAWTGFGGVEEVAQHIPGRLSKTAKPVIRRIQTNDNIRSGR